MKTFLLVLVAGLGLSACKQPASVEVAQVPQAQTQPQEFVTSTGVTIRTYHEPEIIRQSLAQP